MFPSPCGVWVVSIEKLDNYKGAKFPSPCGVWVVSREVRRGDRRGKVSVPLRGVGCFTMKKIIKEEFWGFRPLAGCGLFRYRLGGVTVSEVSVPLRGVGCFCCGREMEPTQVVSVPLRGVGCFPFHQYEKTTGKSFRPLAGCGLFLINSSKYMLDFVSVPLRGVGCFEIELILIALKGFPSPCGVWVVSNELVKAPAAARFRPLAGCGLFLGIDDLSDAEGLFPSPCGVWVVSTRWAGGKPPATFPSPCGVWVVSMPLDVLNYYAPFPSPCGVWVVSAIKWERYNYRSFRPLAGCGLFQLCEKEP